jgi:uncharacterized heparinase superfamily protein
MADDDSARDSIRLVRPGGDRGPSLAERVGDRLDRLRFQAPWYRLRLRGRFPLKLLAVPPDPVTGDEKTGQRLKAGRLYRAGHGEAIKDGRLDPEGAPAAWRSWMHGWLWLRDLASLGTPDRRDIAAMESLAKRWLQQFSEWHADAWAPAATGQRILMAAMYAPVLMPGVDHVHRSAVLNGIARWARHLEQAAPRMPDGVDKLDALVGILGAGLVLPGGDDRRGRAEAMLAALLDQLLSADGAIVSRCPFDLGHVGDQLLVMAAFYGALGRTEPTALVDGLQHVRAGLSGIALGNGVPAAWHGGSVTPAQMARIGASPAAAAPGRGSGYQLLAAGGTRVIVDAGPPPTTRNNPLAHASTLAFTMSDGDRLLVVNIGGERLAGDRTLPAELRAGLRSTAAHSTLTIDDCNSSRLGQSAGRSSGVEEVVGEFRASNEGQWLEARHDGYCRRFGVTHLRRLWLSPDGHDLRGEDVLEPARGALSRLARGASGIAIRFHLAPDARATLTDDGKGALITLADRRDQRGRMRAGPAWAFRASFKTSAGLVRIEDGIWINGEGEMVPTRHLLLATALVPDTINSIGWSLRRASG